MEISSDAEIRRLFLEDTPLIDVRAPVEFARGAFPCAVNLPLMDDAERHQVGIRYRQAGPESAVRLGYELVSGETRESRVRAWCDFVSNHREAALYCFRGGQRSGIACDWLRARHSEVRRISGGYKRMRGLLLKEFEDIAPLLLVSGHTGCGKTAFLNQFRRVVDLERLARHRGSAFGGRLEKQPNQVDFENTLAIQLMKLGKTSPVLMEDEGRLIGRIHLPRSLQSAMAKAPIMVISAPFRDRADRIHNEYILRQWSDYRNHYGDEHALSKFSLYLSGAVDAIRRRLGGSEHQEVRKAVTAALVSQEKGDLSGHRHWINRLLTAYYDPMYNYQLSKKKGRIVFEGSWDEATRWLVEHYPDQRGE